MHKKGLTEEVAKKRSRKTVKYQRGIVGADVAAIQARRTQTAAVRTEARQAAIAKAKAAKKEKEGTKTKTKVSVLCRCDRFLLGFFSDASLSLLFADRCPPYCWLCTKGQQAADEGWQGRSLNPSSDPLDPFLCRSLPTCILSAFIIRPSSVFFPPIRYPMHESQIDSAIRLLYLSSTHAHAEIHDYEIATDCLDQLVVCTMMILLWSLDYSRRCTRASLSALVLKAATPGRTPASS